MEAIILAGGLGSRLKSVIKNIPKPMAPISGFPFLELILKNLNKKGFKRIIISTFYKSEVIENYFADRYQNMEIIYTKEKDTLGTGGAINFSLNFVSNNVDHIYVLNGDTFLDLDIKVIEEKWLKYKEPILVGVEVDACERYGKFLIKNGYVEGMHEKGIKGRGIINAGCYVFPKDFLKGWRGPKKFSLEKDYLNSEFNKKRFLLHHYKGLFIDIGVPSDYEKAKNVLGDNYE